ncbi:mucin-6-like isoform 2-T2 [Gastrophryne carolinensis]
MALSSTLLLANIGACLVFTSADTVPHKCFENSEYKECGLACPPTCNNPKPQPCMTQCTKGCFCNKGFLLLNTSESVCVEEEKCTSCTGNRTYTYGGACPKTCINKDKEVMCTMQAVLGCHCKKDYVFLDDEKKQCVLPKDCPKP